MSEKKPCVLEGAEPGAAHEGGEHEGTDAASHAPCALLCATTQPFPPMRDAAAVPKAPPEDESADPVGDGHSDAEWAARHPPAEPEKKA